MTLREAFTEGLRTEQAWNERMFEAGLTYARLPVPRLDYRIGRGVRFAFNILREKLAACIAPWIVYPDVLNDHGLGESRPMTDDEAHEVRQLFEVRR